MNLKPFTPFEPVHADQIPHGEQWIAQVKWDGVRVLTYYDGQTVRLFNRKLHERTFHYPEVAAIDTYCNADSVVLDGEVIALGEDGKPSFHDVMHRDGIRRLERVQTAAKKTPISYMIFDVVYYNNEWIHNKPLRERLALLNEIITPNEQIQVVPSIAESEQLMEVMEQQNMEGIIVKDLNSPYQVKGKDKRWRKIKNYRDINAVIGGVTLRDGIVNAMLLGCYDQKGHFWYIGHAGAGKLKKSDWQELTKQIDSFKIEERPFFNKPSREKEAIWFEPRLSVKVQFMEWTKRLTLRQPTIQAFVDAEPEECMITTEFVT
ncbi:DNA ligase [Ammoniphilus oxalaticus]|uniref:DNA ligase (ATP) n=1 Tax=Ammoniphilus oxalaticus TaxID=66863 RepID=A0A419SNC6_9BACL|nr:RNA ligase family protein [Ammoniphilus oxalaticus]RKD25752.1 DNA ligase [Ammoniphilus oxalaticus]